MFVLPKFIPFVLVIPFFQLFGKETSKSISVSCMYACLNVYVYDIFLLNGPGEHKIFLLIKFVKYTHILILISFKPCENWILLMLSYKALGQKILRPERDWTPSVSLVWMEMYVKERRDPSSRALDYYYYYYWQKWVNQGRESIYTHNIWSI